MRILNDKNAMALVLMIFLMIACALVAATAFSILATDTESGLDFSGSIAAEAIAVGGQQWYLEQLENDTNWTDQSNLNGIVLGDGMFDVIINSASATEVNFSIRSTIPGGFQGNASRVSTITAKRSEQVSKLALYWGRDDSNTLRLNSGTTVDGHFWSRGTSSICNACSVTENSFRPDNQDITGGGSYTEFPLGVPYPEMPQIDETFYDDLISSFNSDIVAHGGGKNITLNKNLVLNGNIVSCKNFKTRKTLTISGHGYIIAERNILLHSETKAKGTLTITPSGGNIYLLAGRNLTVNSTEDDTNVVINQGAYLYSRDQSTKRLVNIRQTSPGTTNIDGAMIIGGRRIIVRSGAQVTNSTLYVDDTSDTNNYLMIRDAGTFVSGNVFSVSGRAPGMILNNASSITGFVYHWGDTTGRTNVDNTTIIGSLVASQFQNTRVRNSTITYDESVLPSPPPPGFENLISTLSESWDDQ